MAPSNHKDATLLSTNEKLVIPKDESQRLHINSRPQGAAFTKNDFTRLTQTVSSKVGAEGPIHTRARRAPPSRTTVHGPRPTAHDSDRLTQIVIPKGESQRPHTYLRPKGATFTDHGPRSTVHDSDRLTQIVIPKDESQRPPINSRPQGATFTKNEQRTTKNDDRN